MVVTGVFLTGGIRMVQDREIYTGVVVTAVFFSGGLWMVQDRGIYTGVVVTAVFFSGGLWMVVTGVFLRNDHWTRQGR